MKLNKFVYLHPQNGPVAQLNRVSDYGSEGSRFESWRGHKVKLNEIMASDIGSLFFRECCNRIQQ